MASVVEVKLELCHRAKVRDVPSLEGHTHDWVIFVKGSEGINLEHFVEKVVFWLHESYESNRRVIKSPPYRVEQSGFAGFNMLIDVHFRNKEDPKMVRFQYDLFLHTEAMPPVNHTRLEKLTFTNPTEDFREKLLAAGATLINASRSKHTSKDRSGRDRSPSLTKKDKSRSGKDRLKHRDKSLNGREEGQKKGSSYPGKKDGRVAGKDMKRHKDDFKQPKGLSGSGRIHKDSAGADKADVASERGRPEKRRSLATDDEGSKRKKKRHVDDHAFANDSRSLGTSVGPSGPVKKKEKIKIKKEKPDVIAGLFAPENSININQIKQSKEKAKHEEEKNKKAKTWSVIPSNEGQPAIRENAASLQGSKISGDLTVKIKRENFLAAKDKKVVESTESTKEKKKRSEKGKKRSKENLSQTAGHMVKPSPKSSIFMKSSESSSSSDSDMDISDVDVKTVDKAGNEKSKYSKPRNPKEGLKSKVKSTSHSQVVKNHPHKQSEHSANEKLDQKRGANASHSSKEIPLVKQESKTFYENRDGKNRAINAKHKKSSKDDRIDSDLSRYESSNTSSKPKKHKRSSKEKSSGKKSTQRVEQHDNSAGSKRGCVNTLSNSSSNKHIVKIKKEYPSPGATFLNDASVAKDLAHRSEPSSSPKISSRKSSSKTSSQVKMEANKKSPKQGKKASREESFKNSPAVSEKKKIFKSNSYVETSSDEDSDAGMPEVQSIQSIKSDRRKNSISSSSSLSSDVPSDEGDPAHDVQTSAPPVNLPSRTHSSSSESSDDDVGTPGNPANEGNLPVILPLSDHSRTRIDNYAADTAYHDMEISDSSEDSPFQEHRNQDDVTVARHETHEQNPQQSDMGLEKFALQDPDSSSSEDEESSPEKPFQNHSGNIEHTQNRPDFDSNNNGASSTLELPNVKIDVGAEMKDYPHLTDSLHQELRELQRKLSFVTDVERLRKIASIVAKSQRPLINAEYFDFDLCSLDRKTIHKIEKQLKAA